MSEVAEIEDVLATIDLSEPDEALHYDFDAEFQTKIAALCLRDTVFLQRTDGLIRPEYFENITEAAVVNIVLKYFADYKKAPDKSLHRTLLSDAFKSKIVSKELLTDIAGRLTPVAAADIERGARPSLMQSDISDRDIVIDKTATFARHQAVSKAILEACTLVERHDFAKVDEIMKKAMNVGASLDTFTYDYGDMLGVRTKKRLDREAGILPPTGITTGYADFNKFFYHRGWGRRELSVIMAGAKVGKTTAMISFGINAANAGFNVIYITLEVAAEIVAERMDANISNQLIFELGKYTHTVAGEVDAWKTRSGKFNIVEMPSGTMRVSDLTRLIETHKARGLIYDLVIVDYADLMQAERVTDSTTENSKSIYVNLRGLAMIQDFAVLTATQTNREGAKKAIATMTDVAEDFNKIRIADVVISINRTDEEGAMNQARLFFAACRNQASGFSVRIQQDIDRMRFLTAICDEIE